MKQRNRPYSQCDKSEVGSKLLEFRLRYFLQTWNTWHNLKRCIYEMIWVHGGVHSKSNCKTRFSVDYSDQCEILGHHLSSNTGWVFEMTYWSGSKTIPKVKKVVFLSCSVGKGRTELGISSSPIRFSSAVCVTTEEIMTSGVWLSVLVYTQSQPIQHLTLLKIAGSRNRGNTKWRTWGNQSWCLRDALSLLYTFVS